MISSANKKQLFRRVVVLKFTATIIIFVLFSTLCHAQRDSAYIAPFEQELSIGTYTYYQFINLTHEIDDQLSVTYMPNSPVGLGLSVAYKSFSLSLGMGFNFLRSKDLGDTRVIDWQYHYYGKRFILDIFFGNYKGFYTSEKKDMREVLITLYPDLTVVQYGMHGQYLFNYKKFSYRAAFSQSERQLKSAGSFQLGGGFYYNYISSDSSLTMNGQQTLNNYQLSISGGYIYTFVIKKNYMISIGLTGGIHLSTEHINHIQKVEVSPSVFPRFSISYNSERWALGISSVLNNMYMTRNDALKMLLTTGYAEMNFKYRFDTGPNFLHKIKWLN